MSITQEPIDVRVSKRILWFDSDAYPLPNITRASTLILKPDRGAVIRAYAGSVAVWLIAAFILVGAAPGLFSVLVLVAVLGWVAVKTYRLVELLKITLYELVIETAAGSHRGLVSLDPDVVADLCARITDAIDNPHAEFQQTVYNVNNTKNYGDIVNTHGPNSPGKVAR